MPDAATAMVGACRVDSESSWPAGHRPGRLRIWGSAVKPSHLRVGPGGEQVY